MTLEAFQKSPPSESCRIIEFKDAEVRPGIVNGTYFLFVSGTAPCFNMQVRLEPRIYVKQPDYWGIEVVGCLPGGVCLPAERDFNEMLPLAGIIGTKGIEVIGASRSEKIDVP